MRKKGLSEEQADRVLAALRRRLEKTHEGNQAALSRELGIAAPSLWLLLNGRTKPSLATAEHLARALGVSVESVLADPRDRAAALAREGGIPEPAIRRVLQDPAVEGKPVLYYLQRMVAASQFFADEPPASQISKPARRTA